MDEQSTYELFCAGPHRTSKEYLFKAIFTNDKAKEAGLMARHIVPGTCVVDVGSHAGFFSRCFADNNPGGLFPNFPNYPNYPSLSATNGHPTGFTRCFACLIWIEWIYSWRRSPPVSSQEMSKSRSSTSPTRQSHEVRGSPTKLAGDKTGPTVGLDSFAIQTAKKTFTVSP